MFLFLRALLFVCVISFSLQSIGQVSWSDFLRSYNAAHAGSREAILEKFWLEAVEAGTPLPQSPTEVVFLYRGEAASVGLKGDMTGWSSAIPFSRLAGTDLFHLRQRYESDARLTYHIVVDGVPRKDSLNKGKAVFTPESSELIMAGFFRSPFIGFDSAAGLGRMFSAIHKSVHLDSHVETAVYFPSHYASDTSHYPVAYFNDGADYANATNVPQLLDNMIAYGEIRPVIAVFVVLPRDSLVGITMEYPLDPVYTNFLCDEVVPRIDSLYRTINGPEGRLIVGSAGGGRNALFAALSRPGTFGNAASQSGYVSFGRDSLIRFVAGSKVKPVSLYLGVGTYERAVTGFPKSESDFLSAHRRFSKTLEKKRYRYVYRELHDGHSWGQWGYELPHILRLFFKPTRASR